ncbi:outer membrane protein assembly factor BamD [Sphingobacterium yanglingense]|uniref:Tetratricopeptide repeat protein n=1 Tax=Sphingobacterium yanglingense TaxID=1437280 RepID=A0A4R6WGT2_9SPHI|nr:hypothetical protein [Sphingobacterium yanglingense]TDQ76606.1 hypothetical protein CLV99_3199 [Sphingobacterium yanglingense]
MKQIIALLIFLCVATVVCAQNPTEAKMAYQMAEEKFDAKQYTEALDYLEKAETALGSTNPPMLFLKVMITNQIVTAKESTDNYRKLEKAIVDFDKHKDKNALGEDKLMEVYRIKMDLDKRKTAYEKEASRTAELKKHYEEMVYRLATEFPKTEVSARDFFMSIPSTWLAPDYKGIKKEKQQDKYLQTIISEGKKDYFYYGNKPTGSIYFNNLKMYNTGDNRVKEYQVWEILKSYHKEKENTGRRVVTVEEICNVLNITPQQWNDFTTGADPLIRKDTTSPIGYWISGFKGFEKKTDGEYKYFQIFIHEKTLNWGTKEELWIQVLENTF